MTVPLCVDLDGTLIKSDLLHESFILLIKRNVGYFFLCFFWVLFGGPANLKHQIAQRTTINPSSLLYRQSFLSFLKEEKEKGRELFLVTAANIKFAMQVSDFLGIFSDIFASDAFINLKGQKKKEFLNEKFGVKQYDYAGNARSDIAIWSDSYTAIILNPKPKLVKKCQNPKKILFENEKLQWRSFFKALRVHQYVKNLLVFLPLISGHALNNIQAMANELLAFIAFCLVASSAYILNDFLDIEADRAHHTKCSRPFASGQLSMLYGFIGIPVLFLLALNISAYLSWQFIGIILTYYVLTILYSFYLKKLVLMDVFGLAILYTLRIIGGIAASDSLYSPWLLSFSMFIFLSLAFVKRYAELNHLFLREELRVKGRGYTTEDREQLRSFGTVSGYLAVLILALYIHSDISRALYATPSLLWALCFILLFWISRVWMLAARGQLQEDPILFALRDRISWCSLAIAMLVMYISTYSF